jgi:hypothetical protein
MTGSLHVQIDFTLKKISDSHFTGYWVGPGEVLEALEKRKVSCPY